MKKVIIQVVNEIIIIQDREKAKTKIFYFNFLNFLQGTMTFRLEKTTKMTNGELKFKIGTVKFKHLATLDEFSSLGRPR